MHPAFNMFAYYMVGDRKQERGSSHPILCIVALCMLLSVAGCGSLSSVVEPIVYAQRGGWSPQTEFKVFAWSVDLPIQSELAGKAALGFPTWKAYWQDRYKTLRRIDKPAELQHDISYIHQERRRYGLPLYDG